MRIALAVLVACTGVAAADELPLALVDRVGDGAKAVGADVAVGIRSGVLGTTYFTRTEVHARFGAEHQVTIAIPFVVRTSDAVEATATLGVAQLGWMERWTRRGDFGLYSHVVLGLPTASEERDEVVANIFGGLTRPGELALAAPRTAWARLALSPTWTRDCWFGQAVVGGDFPLGSSVNVEPAARVGAAIGRRHGPWSVAGEALLELGTEQLQVGADSGVLGVGATGGYTTGPCALVAHGGVPLGAAGDYLTISFGLRCAGL